MHIGGLDGFVQVRERGVRLAGMVMELRSGDARGVKRIIGAHRGGLAWY